VSSWGNLDSVAQELIASRNHNVVPDEANWFSGSDDDPEFVTFMNTSDERAVSLDVAFRPRTHAVRLIPAKDFDYDVDSDAPPREIATHTVVVDYMETDDLGEPSWRPAWATQPVEAVPGWSGGGPLTVGDSSGGTPPVPPTVDHRARHSTVKNQGDERGTCVSHATCGLLESIGQRPSDLSEQMMHFQFMEELGIPHTENVGIKTTDAPMILTKPERYTCAEQAWPYVPTMAPIKAAVSAGSYSPPVGALAEYGVDSHNVIGDGGLSGASIKNTRYLETLLDAGFDIVVGAWASWQPSPVPGVIEPVLVNGQPASSGGHAMVVVGYNQPAQYFILKNSWSADWEHAGYGYFSYDFVRACFKYGFIVTDPVPA
jgi:Cysteine protease